MPYKAVIFDLDGTLLNTLDDIADSMNTALSSFGFLTHPTAAYLAMIGHGTDELIQSALPVGQEARIPEVLTCYRAEYDARLMDKTKPYPGIAGMLDTLQQAKIPLCVLSNKYDACTKQLIAHYFPRIAFAAVTGNRPGLPAKPDKTSSLLLAREAGFPAGQFLFVGDSDVDMQTARNAGMTSCGVTWGFRSREVLVQNGAAHIANRPEEIASIVLHGPAGTNGMVN